MYKKAFLLFLSVLFILTSCSKTDVPAEHTTTKENGMTSPSALSDGDENGAASSSEISDAHKEPDADKTPSTNGATNEDETTNNGTTDADETTDANDSEETLNNILNNLQELDELMNGA